MNPDKLSFSESSLIVNKLQEFNLFSNNLIINKFNDGFDTTEIENKFEYKNLQIFPQSTTPLLGLNAFEKYLKNLDSFSIE